IRSNNAGDLPREPALVLVADTPEERPKKAMKPHTKSAETASNSRGIMNSMPPIVLSRRYRWDEFGSRAALIRGWITKTYNNAVASNASAANPAVMTTVPVHPYWVRKMPPNQPKMEDPV